MVSEGSVMDAILRRGLRQSINRETRRRLRGTHFPRPRGEPILASEWPPFVRRPRASRSRLSLDLIEGAWDEY